VNVDGLDGLCIGVFDGGGSGVAVNRGLEVGEGDGERDSGGGVASCSLISLESNESISPSKRSWSVLSDSLVLSACSSISGCSYS
jgi:hypothetical protein